MNNKINELLDLYDNTLMSMGVPRIEHKFETPTSDRRLSHLRHLIDAVRHGDSAKTSEANRLILLGQIMGGLWAENIFAPHVIEEHRRNLLEGVGSAK